MKEMTKFKIYITVIALVILSVTLLLTVTSCEDNSKENETTKELQTTTEKVTEATTVEKENTTSEETTTEAQTTEQMTTIDTSALEVSEYAKFLLEQYEKQVNNIDGIKRVCIDPGHQGKGNNSHEPIGPGATETKKRVSYGTAGISTGNSEYQFNLELSLMLKEELIKRGYEVIMVREVNEVDISNAMRAIFGNNNGADIAVRIHANGSEDNSVHGALTIYPTKNNKYIPSPDISEKSQLLSEKIIDLLCSETGAKNRGALGRDSYTGSNWSKIPVTIVENGYMSNPAEDELLSTKSYREKLVKGIVDGIDAYFSEITEY